MESTDQMLLGTIWTRNVGKHGPVSGTIDQTNDHGPRLKLGDGSHRRLAWAELDFGWEPKDNRSKERFYLWKRATHIEYLDRLIERTEAIMPTTEENGTAVEIEQTKECHGAWHKKKGKYMQVALSEFDIVTRGPNSGHLGAVCRHCVQRHKDTDKKPLVVVPAPAPSFPTRVVVEPGIQTVEGTVYRWKITVTVSQDHFVQGKDFLDAAAQVSGLGEITRVEKL